MNRAQMDKDLEAMIKLHGVSTVRKHLQILLPKSNWSDWQRVNSWITNTANRLERQNGTNR